jgi:hypothetical protein
MRSSPQTLPFVDAHHVTVAAPATAVWDELGANLRGGVRLGRLPSLLLGTDPSVGEGDPLSAGSTLPGFAVLESVPGRLLVLVGRHRFSEYELVWTLEEADGVTVLGATTYARFPGVHGRLYRALVIDSRGHRLLVRRWLRRIRDAATVTGHDRRR